LKIWVKTSFVWESLMLNNVSCECSLLHTPCRHYPQESCVVQATSYCRAICCTVIK
jgi:hypothetical protein